MQHTSGTLTGSGLLDPKAKGMAPEATLYAWNFNTQQNGLSAQQEMLISARDYGVVITSNSYGVSMNNTTSCVTPPNYGAGDLQLDQLQNLFPSLLHVFSAGNDQGKCTTSGNRYFTSTKRAKNSILVGALDQLTGMTDFSSWGPMNDGRILPHITAFGDYVYSTVYDNKYADDIWSGTSMACPNVSGTATLLYERYKQIFGANPVSSLIKGALLNSAEDKGNPGPDYQFGYGAMDGVRAVEIIEKNRFFVGSIENGEEQTYTINIPAGAKEVKVMLVWNDIQGTSASKALINDLDLTLENGGTTHLPWILNPNNPSANATKGIDRLNNQEQITLTNPAAGSYTIRVKGYEVPSGPQQYSVVYDYYMPTLMLTYPNGGESFNPGDKPVIRWSSIGYTGTYTLQISTDNGTTFQTIAANIPNNQKDYIITVPNTITNQGLIRVIQDGTMDVNDAPFSIMNVASNLQLVPATCGASGWKLSWNAVTDATKYKVLKANVNEGTYTEIGETTNTTYDLPALNTDRNIYSVAAVSADGAVSERAYAVIANPSVGVDLQTIGLPFEEKLIEFPSNYVQVSSSIGVNTSYVQTLFEYSGAHIIKMLGNETTTTTWNATGDLFANNPNDVASAKICDINATNINGQLWLRLAAVMANTAADNARFRVLADGTPVANTNGDVEISSIGSGQNIMYWDLSSKAGSKFSLEFQAVLRNAKDSLMFGHFQIWQPKNDVSITKLTVPTASATLGVGENITIDVRNYSGNQLANIPVSYNINGGTPVQEVIAGPIAPFKTVTYTFANKANLSEVDVIFNVEATVLYTGDETASNNSRTAQTTRFGDYFVMPKTTTGNTFTATATTKLFTDDGGKVLNYGNSVSGAVVIKPTTTGKKVKVKLLEFDVENIYDKLTIRDGNSSTSPVIVTLTGNSYSLPKEFVSTVTSGELYVEFKSDSEGNRTGWLAEISEVSATNSGSGNTFALTSISNYNGNYSVPSTISINVKNQGSTSASNVQVQYRINSGTWVSEQIASIAAGATASYNFTQKATVSEVGKDFTITARVIDVDEYMDDNTASKTVKNDIYCFPYSNYSTTSPFFISKLEKNGIANATSTTASPGAYPQYFRNIVFPLYKDLSNETFSVTINSHQTNGKLGIFIDWNNDGDLTDAGEGPFSVSTTSGTNVYNIPVTIPTSATAGQYYMRLRASTNTGAVDPCRSETSNNGEIEDYKVELFNNFPISKDVAVTATNLVSGSNYTTTETVKATIKNNASVAVSNFDIAFKVNDGTEVKETVTETINAFGTYEYTFAGKANLSAAGSYAVEIYTLLADDQTPENNKLTTTIFNEAPATDGFFALNFDGVDDVVNAGTLNGIDIQTFTYEAWINPASYGGYGSIGFGNIFRGKNAIIFITAGNSIYPAGSMIISGIGGFKAFFTQENTIELNKWQHISVTYNSTSNQLKAYINGVEQTLTESTSGTVAAVANNATSNLYIGNSATLDRQFNGMIDEARVWNVVRTQVNIQTGMYAHQTGETGLVAEFRFDEGYYNSKAYSGTIQASILNADLSNSEGSIWTVPTVEFASYGFASQVIGWEKVSNNYYKTEVATGTDLTNLVANFAANYPNATVKVGATNQVSGSTPNNFTNSVAVPVQYDLATSIFGKNITNSIQFSVKEELNNVATMNTFSISSLSLNASPVTMNMVFDVNASAVVTALVPTFTLSAGAKAYVNGEEVISGTSAINFSNPVVFTVIAENGRTTSLYNVSIRKSQTISWTPASLAKTYGDNVFTLEATSSADAPIVYTSNNPDVISVVLNKATVKGIGNATITAYQYGSNTLAAATPVEKAFIVNKKELTVTADNKTIDYSDAIPALTMSFNGFVNGETQSVIDVMPTISTTAVQGSPAGTYPITLAGGTDNNYFLTLVNGTLTINDVSAYDVTFNVTYNSNPEQDAIITINGLTAITNASGSATVKLKAGTYTYNVTKAGREDYAGTVTVVSSNITVNVALIATLPTYTVSYLTDGNGTISGAAAQSVKQGQDGAEVTAMPKFGYNFDKWSDNITTATRKETNVQSDITVTAQFVLKTYTLTYYAGTNGTISGTTTQTVQHGSNGTAVTVIPNSGYSFVQWSDGVKSNPRTDENVIMDKNVTAEYSKIYTLPYTQTFDGTTLPEDWMNVDNAGSGGVWTFKAQGKYPSDKLTGSTPNMAFLDSDTYGSGKAQNADLVSPMFDLTSYSTVTLKFKHYYKHFSNSSATLSYSINGGAWVQIQKWTASTTNPEAFEQQITAVAGQNNVRFKWNYVGSWAYYWIVDDIEITGTAAATNYTLTYRAGANGSITGATAGVLTQTVAHGSNGTSVTAVPDAGYAFYNWSDGVTANPRTDINVVSNIDVTAIFGSSCTPISSLPYIEDFNAKNTAPDCWSAPGSTPSNFKWEFGTLNSFGADYPLGTTGNNAYFNSSVTNYGTQESANLVSPTFDFSGQANIYLSFKHFHYSFGKNTSTLSYSIDGGANWTTIQAWSTSFDDMQFFNQKIAAVAGQSNVKFRWNSTATWDFGWIIDDIEVKTVPSYMLTYYVNDDSYGYINGPTIQIVDANGNGQQVSAVANSGYKFVKWSDGSTQNPRTDINVNANLTVTAEFEADVAPTTYTLTYTAGANGSITGEATQTVAEGGSGTEVEAVANTGYHFVKWSDDVTTAKRTDINVTANISVTAEFAINTYTLTYTAGANGSITGTLSQTVNYGASGTEVEAVAATGYKFAKWSDGLTTAKRTDSNITANIDVTAEFELNTGIDNNNLSSIVAYPNPFNSYLYINNSENVSLVIITDLIGREVMRQTNNGLSKVTIETASLKSGIYLVTIITNTNSKTVRKVVKE